MNGTETGIIINPEIPGVAVFANANPGMLVGNDAGVDALHHGTDVSIEDEPNQEEDENGENHLSRRNKCQLQKEMLNTMSHRHNGITSATIEHVITNIDTTLQNMTLAMTKQFLPAMEVLMFSRPLKCP